MVQVDPLDQLRARRPPNSELSDLGKVLLFLPPEFPGGERCQGDTLPFCEGRVCGFHSRLHTQRSQRSAEARRRAGGCRAGAAGKNQASASHGLWFKSVLPSLSLSGFICRPGTPQDHPMKKLSAPRIHFGPSPCCPSHQHVVLLHRQQDANAGGWLCVNELPFRVGSWRNVGEIGWKCGYV